MSLRDAMNAAKEAASNLPAETDGEGVGGSTELAPMNLGTSLDSFLSGGLKPDTWIQVKDGGIRLNREDKAFITEFKAELDINSVQFFYGLRAEFAGNNVEYRQSLDGGRTTTKGENFAAVERQWKATATKPVSSYRGANMILILSEDVVQGKTTIPAGTKLGYTTSVTNFYPFQELIKELAAEGLAQDAGGGRLSGGTVTVKCTHSVETNKANQDYGLLKMEVLD
jgi:hypothetical protein